jgi:hypothetical protein
MEERVVPGGEDRDNRTMFSDNGQDWRCQWREIDGMMRMGHGVDGLQ